MKITKIEYTKSQIEFTIDSQTILGEIKVNFWRDTGSVHFSSFTSPEHESIIGKWIREQTGSIKRFSDSKIEEFIKSL